MRTPTVARSSALLGAFAGAVHVALASWCLGCKDLWFDEGYSYWHASSGTSSLLETVTTYDASMPLYYWFLHVWVELGGSELVLRLPSVVFGAGAVWFIYLVGVRLFGNPIGWLSAVALALNPFAIAYSREARGYSLVLFLLLSSTYLLLRALESGGRWWIGYGAVASLAVYTHAFAIPAVGAQLLMAAAFYPFPEGLRRALRASWGWVVGAALLLLAATAAITIPLIDITSSGSYGFIAKRTWRGVLGLVQELAGGPRYIAAFMLVVWIAAVLPREKRKTGGRSFERWGLGLTIGLFVIPLVVPAAINLFQPVLGSARYLIVMLPGLSLLTAIGIARIRPAAVSVCVAVVLCLLLGIESVRQINAPEIESWSSAVDVVMSEGDPTDGLLIYSQGSLPAFAYYAVKHEDNPFESADFPPLRFDRAATIQGADLDLDLDEFVGAHSESHDRTWVVLSHDFDEEERSRFLDAVDDRFDLVRQMRFNGIEVRLYEKEAVPRQTSSV